MEDAVSGTTTGRVARHPSTRAGIGAALVSSALFGLLFFLSPVFTALSGNEVFGWRVVVTLPLVGIFVMVVKQRQDVVTMLRRLLCKPALIWVVTADGLLLGVQLWLFGWAPQSGHGLDASLGYLLLPLVMVMVGITVHRDKLSRTRSAAVFVALLGVLASILLDGGISWVTAVVALGYPLYFTMRRHWRLDGIGALCLELMVLVPVAVWLLVAESTLTTLTHDPVLLLGVAAIGLVSAAALVLYLTASRVLTFSLFGLLTYLEPVLLAAISIVLLNEPATGDDLWVYGPIVAALTLLAVDPIREQRSATGCRRFRREQSVKGTDPAHPPLEEVSDDQVVPADHLGPREVDTRA